MGWPARYEVRVEGVLDVRWSEWFEGLQLQNQSGETILSGTLPDQPALHGILDKVRDLGLTIITVRRLPPEQPGEQPYSSAWRKPRTNAAPCKYPFEPNELAARPWRPQQPHTDRPTRSSTDRRRPLLAGGMA
jgi:hypothetical protein